jgi:hypothetical protein
VKLSLYLINQTLHHEDGMVIELRRHAAFVRIVVNKMYGGHVKIIFRILFGYDSI